MAAKKKATAKKKAPARKKVTAKKKAPAKKKATVKRMSKEEKEYMVVKISSLYWEAFGRCAELPVEPGCFDKAVELGALANLRKNVKELSKFGKVFRDTEGCSKKAGRRAKYLAGKARPKLKTITPEVYEEAFQHVASGIQKVAARRGKSSKIGTEGLLC